jgi:hypothetical protein
LSREEKVAGGVLTAKQAPYRPGTAPALGLRAGSDVFPLYRKPTRRDVMKRRRFAASLALAVVAVGGLANPVAAGEQVPFRGSLEGERVAFVPFVYAELHITGNATQLGQYELVIKANLGPGADVATGTFEFVAANGDTLTGEFIGHRFPTEIPGVNAFVETAIILGGTGRFAGATGGFQTARTAWLSDTGTLVTVGDFEGTISAPGLGNP